MSSVLVAYPCLRHFVSTDVKAQTPDEMLLNVKNLARHLRNSATRIPIAQIGEMDLYITTLQRLRLAQLVTEEEN